MTLTRSELESMVGGPIVIENGVARRVEVPKDAPRSAPARRLEKDEQQDCWRLLRACGWRVWWLSQPKRSLQSAGIPDLLARHQGKRLILWVEVKRPEGAAPWTSAQQDFAESCIEEKETYIVGGAGKLRAWLSTQGFDL